MIAHNPRLHESSTPAAILGALLAFAVVFVIGTVSLREPIATSFASKLMPKMSDNRGA
jgi:hypothetical protein